MSKKRLLSLALPFVVAAAFAACSGTTGPQAECYYNSADGNAGTMTPGSGFQSCAPSMDTP